MEENKNLAPEEIQGQEEEKTAFDFQTIYTTLVLNWKWFVVSVIICLGIAAIYLRFATSEYQANAKILIKDDDNKNSMGTDGIQGMANLGLISSSNGIDNEIEILSSHTLSEDVVRNLKLYVTYYMKGQIKKQLLYKVQPITVDMDAAHLEKLREPVELTIKRQQNGYSITCDYYIPIDAYNSEGPFAIEKTTTTIPTTIATRAGIITISKNTTENTEKMEVGDIMNVFIESPNSATYKYQNSLSVSQTSKTTTIAQLTLKDEDRTRVKDFLSELAIVYNLQANEDKNEVARKTEEFINTRLEKINAELGTTEGQLESYKKSNNMVGLEVNAKQAVINQDQYQQKLAEANTQVALLNELNYFMNQPSNKYEAIPSNVGLVDESSTMLINKYNEIAMERKRLLRTASESSPTVTPLTSQLDDLTKSIKKAMSQSRSSMEIQRNSVASQYNKYNGEVGTTPQQERMLNQIGRQQEVKSGLYLMLLQKREENSISLAATADKGMLIDKPELEGKTGKISPKGSIIYLIALILGIGIPACILFIIQFFHYKIEGHSDVEKLTSIPILADVPVVSDTRGRADMVIHENENNLMAEIFRSMRTNLQFMLKGNQKVIEFTSSTSGEGKTFIASNLAMSFALLGKKVIVVGLDIRKPRLAELFDIDNHHNGITNLLVKDNITEELIRKQIIPSGINDNLELLMAGPTPPNPTELLARKSLKDVIDCLREMYDYVIIDTAPVGLVTDTLQIGHACDATVVLCRADYTPKDSFGYINAIHAQNKLPNMNIVINGIDMSKKKYSYMYGYGKYGKYGRYGSYGKYGSYGNYSNSHYGNKNDNSIKK